MLTESSMKEASLNDVGDISRKRRCLDIGDISRKRRCMEHFEYKVKNFFSLLTEVDDNYFSPAFYYLDGNWQFRIYPFGDNKRGSSGWIGLYLIKVSSVSSDQIISFTLGIKKSDGTDYTSYSSKQIFEKDRHGWGWSNFVERSTLEKDKIQVAPNGTVTFFCRFSAIEETCKEAAAQTIFPENFEKLQKNLESLIDAADGDVILKLKYKNFKAHKSILRVRSAVFQRLFSKEKETNKIITIEVPDCDPAAFKDFLFYLYCGKVQEISKSTVFDLFWVADKYGVQELREKSLEFITDNINIETIYDALKLSAKSKESTLVELVTNVFKEHTSEIITTDKWLTFLKDYPEEANELYIKAFKNKTSK